MDVLELVWLQILDCLLGHNEALFRRAQLKALVTIHSQEVSYVAIIDINSNRVIGGQSSVAFSCEKRCYS